MQTQPTGPKPARVDELDGLRGLLALWVAVSHIVCLSGSAAITLPFHLESGWIDFVLAAPAVETFMILSGFAITFLLHARPQSYGEFMIGRFFRIVPTYIVCLALGATVAWWFTPWLLNHAAWKGSEYLTENVLPTSQLEHQHPAAYLFWHLTLLHGAVPNHILPQCSTTFLPPAWSISLEWQFYLLAPLIAWMVRSNIAVLALVAVAIVSGKLGRLVHDPMGAFLPTQLDLFLIGIGSYHLFAWAQGRGSASATRIDRLVLVAFAVALVSEIHSVALQIWVVAFGAGFVSGRDLFSRALRTIRTLLLHRALQYLGRWSYPLYLIHWPLVILGLCLLVDLFPGIESRHALPVMLAVALPVIVTTAALLHYTVEAPLMRLGRRLTHRKVVPPSHVELQKIT